MQFGDQCLVDLQQRFAAGEDDRGGAARGPGTGAGSDTRQRVVTDNSLVEAVVVQWPSANGERFGSGCAPAPNSSPPPTAATPMTNSWS